MARPLAWLARLALRTKVTLVVVAAVVLAITVTVAASYRSVSELVGNELERGLEDRADTVTTLLAASRKPPVRPDTTEQLLLADGTVRPLSPGRHLLPVSEADRRVARTGAGTNRRDVVVSGREYGVLTKPLPDGGAVMVGQHYQGAVRVENAFLWRVPWTTLAATGLSAVLSWIVLGRILRPVRRLARATGRITTTQDLSTPLPPAGADEIGQLTRSFDAMLGALRRSRAQQQQLVQDASHELRTPLTSVRGSAELLQRARGRLDPQDEEQILTTLVTETTALDELVRELVELATDRYTGEDPTSVDLPAVAEDSAQRYRQRTGRDISVTVEGPVPVRARPRALQRCVDNLLSNAVKFSEAPAPIVLRVDGSRLTVRDHGPGIAPDDRHAVFDRFFRGPRTQSIPGSGLGLAIVHDIITADEGTVFATGATGGGAEVGFQLPPHPKKPAGRSLPFPREHHQ
ncbi:HAMP domain-containing sensor histidine kinase [Streptomyces spectabilis]|uniref:histidine kinase n=1 Tax=Streptomyces spectabilis TaxID=68270 RepID=A0A5P2XP28_STRST|nr:HAMP domain-containing sensor histidine kinase [Streptomyces spectabilis]MBB5102480.1 two-component system sensor histidine kinase MprB [Streptomyces spectabilis]MCI3907521.1 HAMP domain-containing histidine kinase [Streptomyces spectabilis]QEV64212.1 sensor histidine kinase [Streptomyces spectabilis]GGV31610.1 two-component sensor histidine kinase [Streptomyces spectabilis]